MTAKPLSVVARGALAASAWACAAPALADEARFPPSLDREALAVWLEPATGLAPEQVVAVSPSAATAVVSRLGQPGGTVVLLLRAEALTPAAAARAGVLAWEMRLEVNCRTGEVRAGETAGYAARTPDGDGLIMAPAQTAWRAPAPGTALASAWRAACDPTFQPPLGAPGQRVAQSAPPANAPPPTPVDVVRAETPVRPPGRGAVQVVSSPSEAETRRRLSQLRARFVDALEGLDTAIEPASVGGRTVYRGLIRGFDSAEEAAAFCSSLKSRGQDCLPFRAKSEAANLPKLRGPIW